MLIAEDSSSPIRLYYRDDQSRTTLTINDVPDSLPELIKLFAQTPSPEDARAGLSMSYSQVVGALYSIYSDQGIDAIFTTEQDRLLADLLNSVKSEEITMRPESSNSGSVMVPIDDPSAPIVDGENTLRSTRRTLLVPVNPVKKDAQDEKEASEGQGRQE
jgi:hypothetical protein